MTYETTQYLVHFGIKGQKWGIRRFQNADGTLTHEGKKRYGLFQGQSKQIVKSSGSKSGSGKVDVKSMSDSDLQKAIRRLEMENSYRRLSDISSKKKKIGENYIEYVSKTTALLGTTITAYNLTANVHNMFSDKTWPTINAKKK